MAREKGSKFSGFDALAVAIGILFSRVAGLIRERVFAHYFGNSFIAGAFRAAMRIPNLLQNLFGEGVLSASFVPVYSRLLAEGNEKEAQLVAGSVVSLLIGLVLVVVALGVTFSSSLVDFLAPGFDTETAQLTISLVRILFPGMGLLVLSAWCLGVLNSHRKFFLSYFAPVLWNFTIIGTLLVFGGLLAGRPGAQYELIRFVAWGMVAGSGVQLLSQLVPALILNRGLRISFDLKIKGTVTVIKNFVPALMARGVVQISAYVDQMLASFLGPSVVSAMAYSQTLSLLPISLFGMSISTTELTELSRITGDEKERISKIRERLERSLTRVAFFVIPSSILFLLLGDTVVATLFQTGKFQRAETILVWWILAASSLGLLSSTQARICTSVFWSLHDTKTPSQFALLRVLLGASIGWLAVFPGRKYLGAGEAVSAAALTCGGAISGWVEYGLIRFSLNKRIGKFSSGGIRLFYFVIASLSASAGAYLLKVALYEVYPLISGVLVCTAYAFVYIGFLAAIDRKYVGAVLSPILRRFKA